MRSRVCMHIRVERTHAHVYLPIFSGGTVKIVSNLLILNVKKYPQGLGVVGVFGRIRAEILCKPLIYNVFQQFLSDGNQESRVFQPIDFIEFQNTPTPGGRVLAAGPTDPRSSPFYPQCSCQNSPRAYARNRGGQPPPPPESPPEQTLLTSRIGAPRAPTPRRAAPMADPRRYPPMTALAPPSSPQPTPPADQAPSAPRRSPQK